MNAMKENKGQSDSLWRTWLRLLELESICGSRDTQEGSQTIVGVNQMERRGTSILYNELSRCKGPGAGTGSFGEPGRKPDWLGEVCNRKSVRGTLPQAGHLG